METELWIGASVMVSALFFIWVFSRHELGGKSEHKHDMTKGDWWEE